MIEKTEETVEQILNPTDPEAIKEVAGAINELWRKFIEGATGLDDVDSFVVIATNKDRHATTFQGDYMKIYGVLDYTRRKMFIRQMEADNKALREAKEKADWETKVKQGLEEP